MLTKEQRAEIRAKTLTDLQFDGELLLEWDSMTVSGLLDALDEMERERDALPSHAQVEAAFQTGKVFGRQEDEREIAAQRNELADVLRSLGIRHRNEDGTKRTADEMWAELKERAIDQEHEGRDGWDD